MQGTFSLFLLLVLFISCTQHQDDNGFLLTHIQDIDLEMVGSQYPAPVIPRLYTRNDTAFLTIYNHQYKEIIVYDFFRGKIVERVDVPIYPHDDIWSYVYHHPDSIFILYNAASRPNYRHDSTLVRFNNKGELLEYYSFQGARVSAIYNPPLPKDSLAMIVMWSSQLEFFSNRLLVLFESYASSLGDQEFVRSRYPVGGEVHLSRDTSFFQPHPVYHTSQVGQYYPTSLERVNMAMGKNGDVLYGLRYSPRVYRYNLLDESLDSTEIHNSFIEEVKPLVLDSFVIHYDRPKFDLHDGSYNKIVYDPFRNQFLRFIRIAAPEGMEINDLYKPEFGFYLLDSTLNKIGEGKVPAGLNIGSAFFTENGICFWNSEKNKSVKGKFIFSEYELLQGQIDDQDKQAPDQIASGPTGLEAYIEREFPDMSRDASIVFLPVNKGCSGCKDFLIQYFLDNDLSVTHPPLYMILAAENEKWLDNELDKYGNTGELPEQILLDSTGKFQHYIDPYFRQARLLLWKNGSLQSEVILNPDVLHTFPEMLNSYKRKFEKQ